MPDGTTWHRWRRNAASSDEGNHDRYAAGEPFVMTDFKRWWLQQLRDRAAAGRNWRLAHVMREPLSLDDQEARELAVQAGRIAAARHLRAHPHSPWPILTPDERLAAAVEAWWFLPGQRRLELDGARAAR